MTYTSSNNDTNINKITMDNDPEYHYHPSSSERSIVVDGQEILTNDTAATTPGTTPKPTNTIAVPNNQNNTTNTTTTTTTYIPASAPSSTMYNSDLLDMKLRRKRRTVIFGVAGGVVGLIVLGPIGGVAGGLAGAFGTKAVGKRRERRLVKDMVRRQQQQQQQQQFVKGGAPAPGATSPAATAVEYPIHHATAL